MLESIIPSVAVSISIGIALSTLFSMIARNKLPIAHSVAIIGFPRSGKTTLITSLFAEIFARRIPSISISPRGDATIKKVNDDISRLESGESLGPTTDQDLFAYRAELKSNNGFFSRKYKIEVGDFPGENSEEFTNNDIEWLHELQYFKWVMEADAFVFVIDIEKVLNDTNFQYRSFISKSFRSSWQKLKDHHYNGESEAGKKPTVLVFTKTDLLLEKKNETSNFREVTEINEFIYTKEIDRIQKDYTDLIAYFESECQNFKVVFTSAYKKRLGIRLGIKELLKGILPKSGLQSFLVRPHSKISI